MDVVILQVALIRKLSLKHKVLDNQLDSARQGQSPVVDFIIFLHCIHIGCIHKKWLNLYRSCSGHAISD